MSEFDPYLQWLGIPPEEQPADHYRLLGIRRFESNLTAIESAADQRMAIVRAHQMGLRGGLTQPLLNQISAAKLCLLNPFSKAEYDGSLGQTLTHLPVVDSLLPAAVPIDPPVVGSISLPKIESADQRTVRPADAALAPKSWLIVMSSLTILAVGVSIWFVKARMDRASQASNVPPVNWKQTGPGITSVEKLTSTNDFKLVQQDEVGSLIFSVARATLSGQVVRESHESGELLVGWQDEHDSATWRFKITTLPSQGIFRVRITYHADRSAAGSQYVVSVEGDEERQDVRARDELVDDEFYFAVKRSGEQTLKFSLRDKPSESTFGLKQLELSVPRTRTDAP